MSDKGSSIAYIPLFLKKYELKTIIAIIVTSNKGNLIILPHADDIIALKI